jgi:PAS domain S-box-containing protein
MDAWGLLMGLAAFGLAIAYMVGTRCRLAQVHSLRADLSREVSARGESEARYRQLFDNTTDAVLVLNLSGAIAEMNPAARAALGRTQFEAAGAPLRDLVLFDDRASFDAMFNAVDFGGKSARSALHLLNQSNEAIPMQLMVVPQTNERGVCGFLVIGRNVAAP